MPFAFATLSWYGPGAAASVLPTVSSLDATAKAWGEPAATTSGGAAVPLAKPTRLINAPATLTGEASLETQPLARARIAATIKVNTLSQDDVTGAVLEAQVEPGLTLREALIDARRAAKLAAALSA